MHIPARRISLLLLTVLAAFPLLAQGPPRVSPMASVQQTVGAAEISITYSRPSVKERTIWGELVPYGEVWRTGANEASTITLSHDAAINGQKLPAGTYGLFTLPQKGGEWTVIFNKEAEQWGAFQYKESEDALRVQVKAQPAGHTEAFLISVAEVDAESAVVHMAWDKLLIPFEVSFKMDEVILAKARKEVEGAEASQGRQVWNWANYYLQQGTNLEEALGWSKIVADNAPDLYWSHALKARLESKAGKAAEAAATGEKALALAKEQADQPGISGDSARLMEEMKSWKSDS